MDDLISRQATIDDLRGKDPSQIWDTADIEVWVNALPSAQPETHEKRTETHACDCISRQAAINEVVNWLKDRMTNVKNGKPLTDRLKDLPSAQPEIIRCKDCKHFEYDHQYIIQGIPVLGHEVCNAWGDGCKTDENGYCFMAEGRTDG